MKVTRTVDAGRVTSRDGNLSISVVEGSDHVTVSVTNKDYKTTTVFMKKEDFLDRVPIQGF